MKLASSLASDFNAGARARGAEYFRSGAVRITAGGARNVEARVSGSRIYDVEMEWQQGQLRLFCECPYFEDTGPCKHLWATILMSDAKDYLGAITRFDPDRVFYDIPSDLGDWDGVEEDDEDDEDEYGELNPFSLRNQQVLPVESPWRQQLRLVAPAKESVPILPRAVFYGIDAGLNDQSNDLVLNLLFQDPTRAGSKGYVPYDLSRSSVAHLRDPQDREVLSMLLGSTDISGAKSLKNGALRLWSEFAVRVMPLIAATGRCYLLRRGPSGTAASVLSWNEGEPWRFQLSLSRLADGGCALDGSFRRNGETLALSEVVMAKGQLLITANRIAPMAEGTPQEWMAALRTNRRIVAPPDEAEQFAAALIEHPTGVAVEFPEDMHYETVQMTPRPCLLVRAGRPDEGKHLRAEPWFDYGEKRIPHYSTGGGVFDMKAHRFVMRDKPAEEAALELLDAAGLIESNHSMTPAFYLNPKQLPALVHSLLQAGWHVEADGKIFRKAGSVKVGVSSGVDWFELRGEVQYGETTAKLPALLAAVKRGDNLVKLDDGTYGMLPEEWLKRFAPFAALGAITDDHLRFRRNQTGVLDALLLEQPEANCDETFARMREELRSFAGINGTDQPEGFVGQLRDYQREGLGWMEFLRRFGFGGCLADDMGVGKTAQVLALLESRRAERPVADGGHTPSLVVVPKSLVFNWKQEAARFTPQLRVLDHTGITRSIANMSNYDVVVTTYGTLRRDAAEFRDMEFDYIVLDEAQAIKNANTDSAKAARLLRGRHRLALSGTPVENHLGELWSIFEFLNPGMLGAASVLKMAGSVARNPSEDTRRLLAHALRPFILRRTKEQVARELPAKSEQTIFCELEPAQRKLYNELRAHYRNALLHSVSALGWAKSKIQVLEALLRLRQAACHAGLLDAARKPEPSAKLEMLVDHLSQIVKEGHKALVFSQFTSLLSIVRDRLEQEGIVYEYLDGLTRDRQKHVERFQTDPEVGAFLISLKAGGLGLNLTAAEYVFLLDPWWNPAVESQAIDRAHRIGQARRVFAYRLIAKDTVEEKVLQLQNTKRELAAAIMTEDNSVIRDLKREDLEMLLS